MSAMDVDYDDSDRKRTSRGKDDDRLSFSLSEDEADDTADSLDIKPPQATVLHRKNSRHKKDKYSLERRVHVSKKPFSLYFVLNLGINTFFF